MKQLFERFEQESLKVEKVLEKSIGLVRERKNPGEDLCEEISEALQDLRSVYVEITEKWLEKAGGASVPAEASVKELETIWQECVSSKQNALKAVLAEFIRVYSDETRYLEAIQSQLDAAKDLLVRMEEDETISPDVSTYAIFLECVKQDLDENEELSNMLEDEGIEGFPTRALMGLQKKKYYIRDEEGTLQSKKEETSEEKATEIADETANQKNGVPAEKESAQVTAETQEKILELEAEPGVLGYVNTDGGRVKVRIVQDTPATSAVPSKYTSRAKDHLSAMVFTLNMMMNMYVFPIDKVAAFNEGEYGGLLPQVDLDYLLAHGYLGIISFTVNGEESKYYAPSSKAYECFRRPTVANYVKQRLGREKHWYPKKADLIYLESWSAVFAYRCKVLMDYMLSRLDEFMIHIYRADPMTDFPYSPHPDADGNVIQHCTGVLTEEDEEEVVEFVIAHIKDHKDDVGLAIVVDSKTAIQEFNEKVADEDEEIRLAMEFVLAEEPDRRYDITGAVIVEEDNAEPPDDLLKSANSNEQEAVDVAAEFAEDETEAETEKNNEAAKVSAKVKPKLPENVSQDKPLENEKTPGRKEFEDLAMKLKYENKKEENEKPSAPTVDVEDKKEDEIEKEETEQKELTEETAMEMIKAADQNPEESLTDNISAESGSLDMSLEEEKSVALTEDSDSATVEEPEEPVTNDEPEAYQEYYARALEAFTKSLPQVGMTLLHALGQEHPEMLVQAERFGYALGDPLLERDNRYQYLQSAFSEPFGQSFGYDALAFAAYLRLYFSQPAVMDPYSIGTIDYLSGNLILDESNAAKGLLYKLSQFTAKHGRGIDDNLLGQVINHKGKNEQISELCSSAKNVLGDRSKCSWSKVSDTYKKLLEEGSVINTLLIMAAADNRKDAEINKSSVRKYYHDNGVDYDALSVLIENTAKELGTSYHQYTGSDWAFLLRNMSEPVEIVGQWFDLVENKHVDKADLISDAQELIKSCTQELEILSKTSLTSGDQDNEVMATNRIIQRTAVYLLERLSGKQTQENYKRYFYIDLLRAPYVALDGRYMPLIEKPEEQVAPQDFYDRIIQYISEDKKPWKSVIEKIFKFSADRNCYDFGSARQIKKYLEETGQASQWGKFDITREITGLNSEDKKKRNQSPNAWQEEFNASIEMAEIDHWIDTFDTHRVEQLVDAQMKLYKNNENFGFFGRGLRNLLEYIQGKAVELKGQYYDELDEQLEGLDEVEKEKPIFEKIRHAIDKLRFEEARAFLDQVKSGNLDIRLYDQQSLGKVFADFIDEYTHLYNDSLRSKNTMLSVCYERAHPNRKNESAVEFLSAWPAENGFVSKDAVRKFVNVLGLPGKEPAFYIKDKNVCLVKFTEVYRTEYDHPIGNFGTRIERAGLSIVIVQGSDDVDEFYKELETVRSNLRKDRKKDSVIPTLLVLVKSSIRLDVRRQLAGKYARNYNIDPFIIMDRVNAFFIAEFNMATRWQHFLHSSLPFQPENPYCIDPNKEIPPEMFFGRSEKLLEIMHTEVAMLVYGGRQLGKTALLHQVRNHLKDPLSHRWASYVDIKGKDVEQAAVCIGKALQDGPEKFFTGRYPDKWKWTWDSLIQELTKRLTVPEDQVDNFFLIIDEADTFLMNSEKNNYRELEDLIALSNKTKTKTNENRFRFVLAGLHNVLRYSNSGNNNIITKIPPEIIPPLEREDARELLEIPLSYLGYDFGEMDSDVIAQIVHAANYFPGLIHVYAHILIKNKHKWFNSATTPFYSLSRNDFLRVLADPLFTNTMKERLDMTLKLDKDETGFYYILALLLANLFYAKEEQEFSRRGVSAKELQEHARGYNPNAKISKLSDEEFANLLDELVQLTIFKREDDGEEYRYFFARTAFLTMLGRSKEVDDLLETKMLEDG